MLELLDGIGYFVVQKHKWGLLLDIASTHSFYKGATGQKWLSLLQTNFF